MKFVNVFSTVDLWKTKIIATHNYWNYNETLAVGGRIRDRAGNNIFTCRQLIMAIEFIHRLID